MNPNTQTWPLSKIDDNPFQMREEYAAAGIEELAIDIARNSLQQIPRARLDPKNNTLVQLVFGHRRARAYELLATKGVPGAGIAADAKWNHMPLIIIEADDFEMFDLGLSENIKRKDLNPIEVAQAMKHYMEFDKTSAQAGEKFGVSDATVRGKVRLLDLPDAAQAQLAAGKISEGTARSLLTLAKLADEKVVKQTLKEIEEQKDELPEAVIENVIDNLNNVKELWASWRGQEEPRTGGRDGWLLDMKNFPNKMLAALTFEDVAEALGITDDKKTLAIVGRWIEGYSSPDTVFDDNAFAVLSAAGLKEELIVKIRHLINPPACTACPFYTVINKTHYCGLKVCYDRKAEAFRAQKTADMSRTLKVVVYQESDGPYMALDEAIAMHKKAFEARLAGLRLVPTDEFKGNVWQHFKGLTRETAVLVVVGESINALAVKGSKSVGKKTEKEKAEMRALGQYRAVRRELVWEYTASAQSLFEGLPLETLKTLRGWKFVGIDDRIPEEYNHPNIGSAAQKLEYARRNLVWALIIGETSHYTRNESVDFLADFAELTGVKAPKALVKRAQEWDAEIAKLAKSVAVETPNPNPSLKGKGVKAKGKKK